MIVTITGARNERSTKPSLPVFAHHPVVWRGRDILLETNFLGRRTARFSHDHGIAQVTAVPA
jgi:hypothetical protein